MTALVLRGDARWLPLADASVDLIVTSPPYFALRSYTDGGEHYAGQIGSEATPAEYIAALVECTREWVRVLKPSGSIFVNLGDKYAGSPSGPRRLDEDGWQRDRSYSETRLRPRETTSPAKSLMLLPERYRIACVDELGLIARAVLIWSKPNGLPESVTDRVRRSHEDWVHLVKQPRYFAAVDEIREAHAAKTLTHRGGGQAYGNDRNPDNNWGNPNGKARVVDPLGKLPGSVWEIATEPLQVPERLAVDHFAAFPSEWPRRLILGWSPSGICTACREGRQPVVDVARTLRRPSAHKATHAPPGQAMHGGSGRLDFTPSATITGYACACTPYTDHPGTGETANRRDYDPSGRGDHQQGDYGRKQVGEYRAVGPWREYHFDRWTPPPTRAAVVLDPFGGTGTTAHVAAALGRTGISVDLSLDYCRLAVAPELRQARRRKVLGLDKPDLVPVSAGQGSLFAGEPA